MRVIGVRVVHGRGYGNQSEERVIVRSWDERKEYDKSYYERNKERIRQRERERYRMKKGK